MKAPVLRRTTVILIVKEEPGLGLLEQLQGRRRAAVGALGVGFAGELVVAVAVASVGCGAVEHGEVGGVVAAGGASAVLGEDRP